MRPLFHTAADLEAFLIERRWKYCFIGGISTNMSLGLPVRKGRIWLATRWTVAIELRRTYP